MAVTSGGARTRIPPPELQIPQKWKERDASSPERSKVWSAPSSSNSKARNKNNDSSHGTERKVAVVYYLSRNGQLEHPHFMEVPLASSDGLYLSDVIGRLNLLRGKGFASMYSWSSKRSYKNGFVWHDLADNDFIYPSHGNEYVLKGSELLDVLSSSASSSIARPLESVSFRSPKPSSAHKSSDESEFPIVVARRRNQSWSSIDLHEYKVYKAESNAESTPKAADASTQTDDKRRRRRHVKDRGNDDIQEEIVEEPDHDPNQTPNQSQSTELSREEISPPPSDSSPETLETLMKADGRLVLGSQNGGGGEKDDGPNRAAPYVPGVKIRASSVLMQLISCGSLSFKDCGATYMKDQGPSLVSCHNKTRLPRGTANNNVDSAKGAGREMSGFAGVRLEDKEYFSGSLIETKKDEVVAPALKRSSSYNADRQIDKDR